MRCSPSWPRFPATFQPRSSSPNISILAARATSARFCPTAACYRCARSAAISRSSPASSIVIAADRDVEISDHALTVTAQSGPSPSPRPSVDRLLATAARTFADELVAVILTGTGSDGATGAQAVKAHGGTVIVQNPDTATYPGMPLAVPSSAIDIVADLEAIGPLLGDLVSGAYSIPAASDDAGSARLPRPGP